MTPLAALTAAGCLAVGGGSDRILVRDIAPAFAEAEALPLDRVVGLAPAPGVIRRFDVAELRRIALRLDLPTPDREVCVERSAAPLDPARILAAMRTQLPDADIELLDYSRFPAPEGELEFLRAGLRGGIWRGAVRYGGRHRMSVWARVKVSVAAVRVVASEDLRACRPIAAESLKLETRDGLPGPEPFPSSLDEVAGRVARRAIRAGTPILSSWLDTPKAVARGETVQVEVREGSAVLQLSAQAQSSGAVGQTIWVINPMSKKKFSARVDGKGHVSVGASK
jgi:flagella basal body P-ring formation protein FlgA